MSGMKIGSIVNGSSSSKRNRTLIYGAGGVGKSTFAAGSLAPVFIDTQDGSSRINVDKFPQPSSWTDVLDAITELTEESHKYKTVVIDLLDDVELLIYDHICKRDRKDNIESYDYGSGYKVAVNEWRLFARSLDNLFSKRGVDVIMVAHSALKLFKNPEGGDYDRYGLCINERASHFIRGWCDTVLFARYDVQVKTDKRKRVRGFSSGERLVHTAEAAAYQAKNRLGLPDTLPLDYAEFFSACTGSHGGLSSLLSEIASLSANLDKETKTKVDMAVDACDSDIARLEEIKKKLIAMKESEDGE